MTKFKQKVDKILRFEFEIQENNIGKRLKEILISSIITKRKLRNYCIDKLGLY